jgi:hypothetical protein
MAIPTGTARTMEVDNVKTALGWDVLIDDENNDRRIGLRLKAQIDAYCVMPSATPKLAIQANRRERVTTRGKHYHKQQVFYKQNQYSVLGS